MRGIALLFFLSAAFAARAQSSWYTQLLDDRKVRDEELKTADHGPIPADYKQAFTGLRYFEPDNRYSVMAEFVRLKKPKTVWFATSDGKEKEYVRFAELRFRLLDRPYVLYAYYSRKLREKEGLSRHIFVPFKDLTNLVETYGGGRYLDLTEPYEDLVQVDFNRAYNPYCAYSDGYSCPKVPEENYLNIRIEAGEKTLYAQ